MEYMFKDNHGYFHGPYKTLEAALIQCKKCYSSYRPTTKVSVPIYQVEKTATVTVQQVIEVLYSKS